MFDLILTIACFYFAYNNVSALAGIAFNQWKIEQYLMVLLTVLLVVAGIYKGMRVVRAFIGGQQKARQQADEIRAGADSDNAPPAVDGDESGGKPEGPGEDGDGEP